MPTVSAHAVDVYPYRRGGADWLVLRRSPGRAYAASWRMVGGKVEGDETAGQTALRELAEETGWAPGAGLLGLWALPSVNAHYDVATDRVVLAPAFAAEVAGDPALDDEHDAFAWLGAEAAASRLAWPEQARLLRLAASLAGAGRPDAWTVPFGG
ncbi:NUDIX domain-containing protein [Rubrivirga sp. IMCC45206]|uniref:NUDIX domain-containing protein n=1 Tax=Rubrivirga sp. IMCC45206 TaxID=3391614 RepID=UPI00398FABB7